MSCCDISLLFILIKYQRNELIFPLLETSCSSTMIILHLITCHLKLCCFFSFSTLPLLFGYPFQQYKIKSSYKAFAAIPTNTLLLEQKVSVDSKKTEAYVANVVCIVFSAKISVDEIYALRFCLHLIISALSYESIFLNITGETIGLPCEGD